MAVSALMVAGLFGGFTASSVAAATKTTVTWKVSSMTVGVTKNLSDIASSNSTGRKTWSKSGSCTLSPASTPTKLIMGSTGACRLTLTIAQSGPHQAKSAISTILRKGFNVNGYTIRPGADLSYADLTGAKLTGADLTGAYMTGTDLTDANLTGAKLSGANLTNANLFGAKLTNADLTGADLSGANLAGANLYGANLDGANLRYANLSWANLRYANLRNANLRNANLTNANLSFANLDGAKMPKGWRDKAFCCWEIEVDSINS